MAKNKRKNKLTVNDLIHEQQVDQAPDKSFNDIPHDDFTYDEEMLAKMVEYNKNIEKENPLYDGLKTRGSKVLVKVVLKELGKDEYGNIVPNQIPIPIPAKSGPGGYGFAESPWPYSRKVYIVCAPEGSSLKKGQYAYLDKEPVTGILGKGENAFLQVPSSFIHPDEAAKYFESSPMDPEDSNYGYLLVNDYDIVLTL